MAIHSPCLTLMAKTVAIVPQHSWGAVTLYHAHSNTVTLLQHSWQLGYNASMLDIIRSRCLKLMAIQSRYFNILGSAVTLPQHLWQYKQSRCLNIYGSTVTLSQIHGTIVTLSQHSWHYSHVVSNSWQYSHVISTFTAVQSHCLNIHGSTNTLSQHSWQLQSRCLNLYRSAVTLSQHSWQYSHVISTFMAVQSRYLKFMAL
jgi:hypothetical protein